MCEYNGLRAVEKERKVAKVLLVCPHTKFLTFELAKYYRFVILKF